MLTNSAHPLHKHRLSVTAALAACALFLVMALFLRETPPDVSPDLSDVQESDRWKYSVAGREAKLAEVRSRDAAQTGSYAWIDQSAGVVRLPIERAMELTVAELQKKQ